VKESVTTAAIRYNKALEEARKSEKKAVPKGTLESRTKQEQYFIRNS
jgi:hypothetical protein